MSKPTPPRRVRNLSLAGIAGLAGLATVIIVFSALLLGVWLDAVFELRGIFAVTLLILSVPVSLFTMLKIVLGSLGRIQQQQAQHDDAQDIEEETL